MKRAWFIALFLAAAVAVATPAAAKIPSAGNPCPAAGLTFTVIAGNAGLVADGFDCKFVDLVINASITPTISTLGFNAKTIQVNPGVTIDNTFSSDSDIFLTAEGGGIIVDGATIRANDHLILECKTNLCPITIKNNSVIRSPINPALTSGDTRAIAHGPVSITNSTFFGQNKVGVFSQASTVEWICVGGGPGNCQDPLTSGVAVALCGNPPGTPPAVFPCNLSFANAAALSAVCTPVGGDVDCGGGDSECQVNAFLSVDLHDSVITCNSHFGVTSKTGSINLRGAKITSRDALTFQAFLLIDATDAELTSLTGAVTLESKGGGGPGSVCIILTGSTISSPNQIKGNNGCLIVP